ncbi:uncharacterized protein LOC114531541 [Dendronephthya gigantea]|uniref:uncharacterized protein LOC114531541 n=1 Tax=Dendronephthya gigantea TaxID=151771 RepID=UPI00106BB2CD|nr:uncharacterized protein LOC114531541 [Dendronephthya gigantea]
MTRQPTLLIYEDDVNFITNSTLQYTNIETGGDLFGLWQNEREVVVQLVSGPGQNCRRTATAFFQDRTYLSNVGNHLINEKGLCNIGEWHSHHRLNLPEPSHGDKGTVWRNMPGLGIKQFLLIIATITPKDGVDINGFIFTAPVKQHQNGEMIRLRTRALGGPNPFRRQPDVLEMLREGAEVPKVANPPPYTPTERNPKKQRRSKKEKRSGNGESKSKFRRRWFSGRKKNKEKYGELQTDNSTISMNVQPHEHYRSLDPNKSVEIEPADDRSTRPLINNKNTERRSTYL